MKIRNNTKTTIKSITAAGVLLSSLGFATANASAIRADFNGDGFEDMAVGMPYEDINGVLNAGAVKVVYGRASGTMSPSSRTAYLHQYSPGIGGITLVGSAQPVELFGDEIAVGDFNDDGFDDIAIGVKYQHLGSTRFSGLVNIAYGSEDGLTNANNHYLDLRRVRGGQYTHEGTYFGQSMAVGDYNGDGIEDLAVGFSATRKKDTYGENLHGGGAVTFYGKISNGLKNAEYSDDTRVYARYWTPTMQYNAFGGNLASGDFNGDSYDDLAISAILDDLKVGDITIENAGSVTVQYGSVDWQTNFSISPKIIPAHKAVHGNFGYAMDSADLNHDGREELLIGAPGAAIGGASESGAMVVAKFHKNGTISQSWYHQSLSLIPGTSKTKDEFGYAVKVGDFNYDGHKDVAIGIPFKDKTSWWSTSRIDNHGEVAVMYGNGWGGFYKADVWHQDVAGVAGVREENDRFGASLSTGDFNNDRVEDLMVGVPYEDIGTIQDVGVIQMIWGDHAGLTTSISGTQMFHQSSFAGWGFGWGNPDPENEAHDQFGKVLP